MKKFFLAILSLLSVSFLSACAQKAIYLNPTEFGKIPKLETLTKAKPGSSIGLAPFTDARNDQTKVGVAKSGIGNTDTPIYLYNGVGQYVTQRFSDGLQKRNVQISDTAPFVIKGVIKKLWITEIAPGFSPQSSQCEVELSISLVPKDPKQSTYWWAGTTSAQGTRNVFNTTSSDGPVLDACVNEAIEKFLHNEKIQKALAIELLPTEKTPPQ